MNAMQWTLSQIGGISCIKKALISIYKIRGFWLLRNILGINGQWLLAADNACDLCNSMKHVALIGAFIHNIVDFGRYVQGTSRIDNFVKINLPGTLKELLLRGFTATRQMRVACKIHYSIIH